MINTTMVISGVPEALQGIDGKLAALKDMLNAQLQSLGEQATAEMIDTHTFQNRTMRLESSIGFTVHQMNGSRGSVELHVTASYASEVEEGHTGARPYPFFWPVIWNWDPIFHAGLQDGLNAVLGEAR